LSSRIYSIGYSKEKKAFSALFCRVEPGKIKILGFSGRGKQAFLDYFLKK
jgi:hypothetical protein